MRYKKHFMIYIFVILLFSCVRDNSDDDINVPFEIDQISESVFFCTVALLRIRSEPTVDSIQIGSLRLFDMATVIERTENRSTIDDIDAYWYKIRFNDIQGYIFGGFGIVFEEKYEVKSINDIGNILSSIFQVEKLNRRIILGDQNNPMPTVLLSYGVTFMNHLFYVFIYYRASSEIDVNDVALKHNLEVRDPGIIFGLSNRFGLGDSYRILTDLSYPAEIMTPGMMTSSLRANDIITNHGSHGRYFFSAWGSEFSYDIANFLFTAKLDNIFDRVLITSINLWLDNTDFENIMRIDSNFIEQAREKRIRESVLFQILHELILRLRIGL